MSETETIPKPLPRPTPLTQPYWDALREHRLLLPRRADGTYFWYPRVLAPGTLNDGWEWAPVSGRGTVYAFTVDRRGTALAFAPDCPYVIAIVELAEGPHLTSNLVGCSPDEVRVGMPVEAVYEDVADDVTLLKFRPASG